MSETLDILRAAVTANDEASEALRGIDKLLDQLGFPLSAPDNRDWFREALSEGVAAGVAKLDGLAAALRAGPRLPPSVDAEDLAYVAEQRAMRVLLIDRGRGVPPAGGAVAFTASERERLDALADLWTEGFREGRQRLRRRSARHRFGGN